MANFIKIGKHRINLDHVSDVFEYSNGDVRVYWDYTVEGEYSSAVIAHDDYKGDEGKLLLALIDQDDETVDRIYSRVNPVKREPVESPPAVAEAAIPDLAEIPY